jgi:hypothetical protein
LRAGRLAAFADNAFSATELLARGELLAYAPTVDLVLDTKDHGLVASTYKLWADLGNTEKRFAKLLKQMSKVRKKGRYLDCPLDLTAEASESLLRSIEEMHSHAAARISGSEMPGQFNVYCDPRPASWGVRRVERLRPKASAFRETELSRQGHPDAVSRVIVGGRLSNDSYTLA